LWDGRKYCRRCVEEVSPDLYRLAVRGAPLEETVAREDVRAINFLAWGSKPVLLIMWLIFVVPFALAVLAGQAELLLLVAVAVVVSGFVILILSLQSVVGVYKFRSYLPRTVSIRHGELCIVTPEWSATFKLTDCRWYVGNADVDNLCMFSGLRRGVVIQTPEAPVACGHSAAALEHWSAFLTLAQIPQHPPHGCLPMIAFAVVGALVGGFLGAAVGYAAAAFTNNANWPLALGLLGLLEGAVVALLYANCTAEGPLATRRRLHPLLGATIFFVAALKFGVGGWTNALVCGGVNAVLGALVFWHCRTRLDAAEKGREQTTQSRA